MLTHKPETWVSFLDLPTPPPSMASWSTHLVHSTSSLSLRVSLVAQRQKTLLPMQEMWVWSQSWEDPLEEEMATHSSILAWKISWTEGPGGLQSMGSQRVRHDWVTEHKVTSSIGANMSIPGHDLCAHSKMISNYFIYFLTSSTSWRIWGYVR